MAHHVIFSAKNIIELAGFCDDSTLNELVKICPDKFTAEQLDEISMFLDTDVLDEAAERSGILPDDEEEDVDPYLNEDPIIIQSDDTLWMQNQRQSRHRGPGFLSLLLGAALVGLSSPQKETKHPGRCTGDCSNCPPHYGYRYGRWYYGHGHVHGCVFHGNRGGGGPD